MASISGWKADVYVTGVSTAFTNVSMTDSGDHKNYTISVAADRYWDDSVAPTVQTSPDNVTWTTANPTTYTVQYVGGKVTFNVANGAGTFVRASGNYLPYSELGQGKEWSLDLGADMADSSVFGSQWKSYVSTMLGATAKVSRFWLDAYFLTNLGGRLVLVLFVDASAQPAGPRYEGYARIKSSAPKVSVSGLAEEDVEFTFDKTLYFVAN